MSPAPGPVHLRESGVSVLVVPTPDGAPSLVHWGADLGDHLPSASALAEVRRPAVPHSALDHPRHPVLAATVASGYTGTPAVEVVVDPGSPARGAGAWSPRWTDWQWQVEEASLGLTAVDPEVGLRLEHRVELVPGGLLRARSVLVNTGDRPCEVASVRVSLAVPAHAAELLDLTGRWTRERQPQRHPWPVGTWSRSSHKGRTGHDATGVLVAGVPGFGFRHGELWAVHVAWSGDHTTYAERTPEGDCVLGGGELLGPGEVLLAPGDSYATPWLCGSWSDSGLDAMSHRFHRHVRETLPLRRPRPVVVNTWEAVYFDHDLDRLLALADAAAEIGGELFVLDDGWFPGRHDDTAGLGDWRVDPEAWPDGLHPLVEHVTGLGMRFGLWVEPEMVNEDSDLARAHPDWLLRGRAALPDPWRHQQVLDLQHPDAFASVRDALLALLQDYPISYLKWDHNRDLVDVAHDGRPAVHGQTVAFYRLLDELRAAHPDVEIESCASGGARVDLEVLTRTERVWASDTLDPVERQVIQRGMGLLVPPERIGSHVGDRVAHTTGRSSPLPMRAATALLGHLGVEWDLLSIDADERDRLRAWLRLGRELRDLVATGDLVHADHPDPAVLVTGVVAPGRDEAAYVVATIASTATQHPAPARLPGLDPARTYRVRCEAPSPQEHVAGLAPTWVDGPGVELTGAFLDRAGVQLPVMTAQAAHVLRVTAT